MLDSRCFSCRSDEPTADSNGESIMPRFARSSGYDPALDICINSFDDAEWEVGDKTYRFRVMSYNDNEPKLVCELQSKNGEWYRQNGIPQSLFQTLAEEIMPQIIKAAV